MKLLGGDELDPITAILKTRRLAIQNELDHLNALIDLSKKIKETERMENLSQVERDAGNSLVNMVKAGLEKMRVDEPKVQDTPAKPRNKSRRKINKKGK